MEALGAIGPLPGNRRSVETNPRDREASRPGWHEDANTKYISTRGNNTNQSKQFLTATPSVFPSQGLRTDSSSSGAPFDEAWEPAQYTNASIIQLFYTPNKFRHVIYKLGFTEAAGNSQTSNFGNGGRGNDTVILNTQDGSGTNNANFATPGKIRIWKKKIKTLHHNTYAASMYSSHKRVK